MLIAGLLWLLGCGSSSQPSSPQGSFAGVPSTSTGTTSSTAQTPNGLSKVALNPAAVVGGAPSKATVVLTQAAPAGGARISLKSAAPAIASVPASLTVAQGQTSATAALTTFPVTSGAAVTITASYNKSVAGANLIVTPPTTPSGFTVTANPSSLSLAQGASGSAQFVTKANGSFDKPLLLTVANDPAGISASLNPAVIAPPGSGTSQLQLSVADNVAAGNYSIQVNATDGTTTHTATLQLTVGGGSGSGGGGSGGSVGTLHGCWYHANGHKYQGVRFSMNSAGTVPFDAVLYFGATCSQFADRFGFGRPLALGGFGYIFWFSDFKDQTGTSAIWMVGNQTSQCVDYSTAPDC
jgi:hypothetical protein